MKPLRLHYFFLPLCTLISVYSVCAQPQSSHDRSPYLKWVFSDAGALITNVDGKTVGYGLGSMGAVALFTLLDEAVQSSVENGIKKGWRDYAQVANLLGDPYVVVPTSLGVFGISLLTEDRRFQDAAFTSAQSLLYASSATLLLKWITGRHRPNNSDSPYTFDPFSSNDAFPSGHTTAAFALLTPWVLYYPHWVTWSLAGIAASSTAFARIALNKHWLSDTFAAAIIGTSMGWVLSRRHQNLSSQASTTQAFRISPIITPNTSGISVVVMF